jgi:hypothetical protein
MLRSFHYAPGCLEIPGNAAGRSARVTTGHFRPTVPELQGLCHALREGVAAWRHYEHRRSRGIAHDTALREALGIGPAPLTKSAE